MAKKIQIEFDLNANDVKIVSDSVLTLSQQVRVLKQELQRTEEGTQQFAILSNKLNETKDNFERVNAKSRELFGTLQLIPGPIGEIGSKIDGTISLFKVFSGFKLSDLKNQFTGLLADLKGIGASLLNLTGISKAYQTVSAGLEKTMLALGMSTEKAASASKAWGAALTGVGIGLIVAGIYALVDAFNSLSEEQKLQNDLAEKSSEIAGKQISTLEMLDRTIKSSTATDRQKDEAVKQYNSTLGDTLGKVENWAELEKKLIGRLPEYKAYLLKRAEAEATAMMITAAISEKIKTEMKDPASMAGMFDIWSRGGVLGFFIEGKKGTGEAMQKDALAKADKTIGALQDRLMATNTEIANQQKQLGLQTPEPTEKKKKTGPSKEEIARQQLEQKKRELDAEIQLEINKDNTDRARLEKKLADRLALEKLTGDQLILAQQENAKKVELALKEDRDRERKRLMDDLDAKIQIEIEKENTSRESLKTLLDERMRLELQTAEFSEAQKEQIRLKYAKQLEEAIKNDSEKRKQILIEGYNNELAAAEGNYEKQLIAYQNFADKIKNSIDLNEKEKNELIKKGQGEIFKTITEGYQTQATKIEESYGEFKRFDQNYYQDQRNNIDETQKKLEQSRASGAITESQYTEQTAQLSKARKDIAKNEASARVETTAAIGNAFGQLSEIVGKDTLAGKAFAIAKTTIDTYLSAQQAFKAMAEIPVVGPALGAVAAAAAIVAGIKNVQKIVSVQVPPTPNTQTNQSSIESSAVNVVATRAQGGFVYGPGSSTSDSIPALLSNGEFVMNARSSSMFAPLLSSMNAVGNQPQFAMGGLAMSNTPGATLTNQMMETLNQFNARPIKTYVTATDMSSQQALDRTTKSRSLI